MDPIMPFKIKLIGAGIVISHGRLAHCVRNGGNRPEAGGHNYPAPQPGLSRGK
jgi:hypothetical protein